MSDLGRMNTNSLKTFQNITRMEKEAALQLSNNPDITIKPADKRGAVVIQTSTAYDKECKRLLGDTRNYTILQEDPTEALRIKITGMVEEALTHDWISQREVNFFD